MSPAAPEHDDRRSRRRVVLLWVGAALVAALVGAAALLGRDGTNPVTAAEGQPADGTGTAPVYDRPPAYLLDPANDADGATPHADGDPSRSVGEPTSGTGAGAWPAPSTPPGLAPGTTPEPGVPPRPHGLALNLTSTLDGPLRPGVRRTLTVSVRNPNPFVVQLFRLDVRVMQPPAAGCLPAWVRTGRYRFAGGTPIRIAGETRRSVPLTIELVDLPDVDQNACKSTTFPLRLSGVAADPA